MLRFSSSSWYSLVVWMTTFASCCLASFTSKSLRQRCSHSNIFATTVPLLPRDLRMVRNMDSVMGRPRTPGSTICERFRQTLLVFHTSRVSPAWWLSTFIQIEEGNDQNTLHPQKDLDTWLWKARFAMSTIKIVQNICIPGGWHLLQGCWSTSYQWQSDFQCVNLEGKNVCPWSCCGSQKILITTV